jgi:hypothetical protein
MSTQARAQSEPGNHSKIFDAESHIPPQAIDSRWLLLVRVYMM